MSQTPSPKHTAKGAGFLSLPDQVAEQIRAEIGRGLWTGWLPGERALSELLQVSRRTVRNALERLVRSGVVETVQGVGHRILDQKATGLPESPRELAVVLKEPLQALRPFTVLWLDELRARLARNGVDMDMLVGRRPFANAPSRALRRLTTQRPGRIWLLVGSNPAMQRWFKSSGLPCIFAGTPSVEYALASVDVDHRALCRHAVGKLWRAGHRRIAYLTSTSGHKGDEESEIGFQEGWMQLVGNQDPVRIHRFQTDTDHAARTIGRVFGSPDRPTGVVVGQSRYYLTLLSVLANMRLRIPGDVSALVRDNESHFRFLRPKPCAYECSPRRMAMAMQRLVMDWAAGKSPSEPIRIMPEFIPGDSIAALSTGIL